MIVNADCFEQPLAVAVTVIVTDIGDAALFTAVNLVSVELPLLWVMPIDVLFADDVQLMVAPLVVLVKLKGPTAAPGQTSMLAGIVNSGNGVMTNVFVSVVLPHSLVTVNEIVC